MFAIRFASLTLALAVLSTSASAADWPEFRGPTAQGLAKDANPPTKWSATENVVWKKATGPGWSSPIIVAGKIYITTAVPLAADPKADRSLRVQCLDAKTGDSVWEQEVFVMKGNTAPAIHNKNSHASPTPLFHDGRIYAHFGHNGTACLDAKTGKIVWSTQEHGYKPVHGSGGSPIVFEGKLIFGIDGADKQEVLALDQNTGKVVWSTPRNTKGPRMFTFSTPLLIEVNGQPQMISQASEFVISYDPRTGKEIWRAGYPGGYSVVPRPLFANGMIYACSGYNTANLLAVKVDGTGDVTKTHVAWIVKKNVPLNPSPVIVDGSLYMISDNGVLTCLDSKSGKELWTERVGGAFSSSMLYAGGHIYILAEDGTCTVFKPGKEYQLVATNKIGERTLASFALDDDAILIRTDKHLYKIASKKSF